MEYLNKMAEGTYEGYSFRQILLALFEELLQDEVLYLQKQEEHLAGLEEELLKKIPDYFYEMIMKYRKRFNIFHAYYEQLMNMGDVMQTSVNGGLSEEEKHSGSYFPTGRSGCMTMWKCCGNISCRSGNFTSHSLRCSRIR